MEFRRQLRSSMAKSSTVHNVSSHFYYIIMDQSSLVLRYIMIKWFGLFNSHEGLILMAMFSIYFTFLMRQYMVGISDEYIEAAKMDGAGYFKIYWKIMLPL